MKKTMAMVLICLLVITCNIGLAIALDFDEPIKESPGPYSFFEFFGGLLDWILEGMSPLVLIP